MAVSGSPHHPRQRLHASTVPDNSGNCIAFDSTGFTEFSTIPGGSSHTVSIFLDGYQTYTTTVYVPEGQEVVVHAELQPMPSPTTSPTGTPTTTTSPDLLQAIIAAIRNLFAGAVPRVPGILPRAGGAVPGNRWQHARFRSL